VFGYVSALTTENMRGTLVTTLNGCMEWCLHQGRCTRNNCSKYHLHPGHVASNRPRRTYQTIGILHDDLHGDYGIKDKFEWSENDIIAAAAINKRWKATKIAMLKSKNANRSREAEPIDAADIELKELMAEDARLNSADRLTMQKATHHVEEPTYLEYKAEQEVEYEAE
jgi:hypothetical protein